MATVLFSLGSNVGRRAHNLASAVARLALTSGVELLRLSPVYQTAPWGDTHQQPFLNLALAVRCCIAPLELLRAAKAIEALVGRVPTRHWGPRVIDIDLIHFEGVVLQHPALTLPHPLATQRQFVLVPLHAIAPEAEIASGVTVSSLARPDDPQVRLLGSLHQVLQAELATRGPLAH